MNDLRIALAGNPNVGKSTIFNCLTGMRQHTGNWVGKTVVGAEGRWNAEGLAVTLTDTPGCYSLDASSPEEEAARDCICSPHMDGVIIVCDGTCLERNLILTLQILKQRKDVILCVNLMDQARRRGIEIDAAKLAELLGIEVVLTETGKRKRLKKELAAAVKKLAEEKAAAARGTPERADDFRRTSLDSPEETAAAAEKTAAAAVNVRAAADGRSLKVDRVLTDPRAGFPVIALMLTALFWLTVQGANYPSAALGDLLFSCEKPLYGLLADLGLPASWCGAIAYGAYRVLAWVVSVMLPPMAIFFPLFTLLEDWGFLPRVAFDLDRCFRCCNACGKQALTMCMGLGCNASAVVGCRIIDSERERLLAMLTNSLVPCNGRFPLLIAIVAMFFGSASGFAGALCVTAAVSAGVAATFLLTKLLSVTLLKGVPSSFTLELPPYRKPRIGEVLVRSVMDRTVFVLGRAATVAAPAGLVIWLLANLMVGGESILQWTAAFFEPLGHFIGLDGVIVTAFILGLPANEIVLPIAMMIYACQGTLTEIGDMGAFRDLLAESGWNGLTAMNTMLFSLMHWPCATTLLSIRKETGSWRWTATAFLAPTALGVCVCAATAAIWRLLA